MNAPFAADGVDRDDMRMMQLCGSLGFARKACYLLLMENGGEGKDLNRHATI